MQKRYCDECEAEAKEKSEFKAKVKIGGEKHELSVMLFVDPEDEDIGGEVDLCVPCARKLVNQVFDLQKG